MRCYKASSCLRKKEIFVLKLFKKKRKYLSQTKKQVHLEIMNQDHFGQIELSEEMEQLCEVLQG